jgi:hypothetical protein
MALFTGKNWFVPMGQPVRIQVRHNNGGYHQVLPERDERQVDALRLLRELCLQPPKLNLLSSSRNPSVSRSPGCVRQPRCRMQIRQFVKERPPFRLILPTSQSSLSCVPLPIIGAGKGRIRPYSRIEGLTPCRRRGHASSVIEREIRGVGAVV